MAVKQLETNLKRIKSGNRPTVANLPLGYMAFGVVDGQTKIYGNSDGSIREFGVGSGGSVNLYTTTGQNEDGSMTQKATTDAINARYAKPLAGIPKADLDSAVQQSLANADNAEPAFDVLPVDRGGTGLERLLVGHALIGAGAGNVEMRQILASATAQSTALITSGGVYTKAAMIKTGGDSTGLIINAYSAGVHIISGSGFLIQEGPLDIDITLKFAIILQGAYTGSRQANAVVFNGTTWQYLRYSGSNTTNITINTMGNNIMCYRLT